MGRRIFTNRMKRRFPRSPFRRLYNAAIRRPLLALIIVLMTTITPAYAAMTVIDPSAIAQIMEVVSGVNESLTFLEKSLDAIETVEKTIGKLYQATVGRARRVVRGILGAKNCMIELDWMFDFSMPTSGTCQDFVGLVRNNLSYVAEKDATEAEIMVELGNAGIEELKSRRVGLHYDATLRAVAAALQAGASTGASTNLSEIATDMMMPQTAQSQTGVTNDLLLVIAGEVTQMRTLMAKQLEMQAAAELLKTGIVFKPLRTNEKKN